MIRTVTTMEKALWTAYVTRSYQYDFYHSVTYHSLETCCRALLYVYEEQEDFVAFPLLLREIEGTDLYDLTSVYGYTGPLCNRAFNDLDQAFLLRCQTAFLHCLKERKVVSVFCRLNPFINQHPLLQGLGGLHYNGKVVVIDLSIPVEVQRSKYAKAYSKIRQLKQKGYYVKECNSREAVRTFNEIYQQNMGKVNASANYLFSEDYLFTLVQSPEKNVKLLLVYNEAHLAVCGTIIGFEKPVIQGHLIATREAYRALSPTKLLVDEISVLGRLNGMKYYNLGGGFRYREDSLYGWKKNFSSLTYDYYSWRYVADPAAYENLLQESNIPRTEEVDFFPLYRLPLYSEENQ